MAPKATRNPEGMFAEMVVFLVENGVQSRRLQIWKQKLVQLGAFIEERLSKKVTHVFAMSSAALLQHFGSDGLANFKGNVLQYQWLEDSLRLGEKVSEDLYMLKMGSEEDCTEKSSSPKSADENNSAEDEPSHCKKIRSSLEDSQHTSVQIRGDVKNNDVYEAPNTPKSSGYSSHTSLPYNPPDLNQNITEIFGKLINIYRAVFSLKHLGMTGDQRLAYKIETANQVKDLPTIGKSMQDHIQEIVTTGKLSKLDHFETDEKVRTITLFGEVWGIGPATALKLYEKGYRTLDDLKNESSLTNSQKLGLKYFDDIKQRIPRLEVQEMELLLQKVGEDILPGVSILCGGSYRRGKTSCGDMDIVITHPDGQSHKGFLPRYVKDMEFLKEDLVFSTHSEEGTDSGVDTYFGLCTYPGREQRHRIDLKVYPRDIYAFGLIAWTGNDVLNRRLRLLADTKGFHLDDKGLYPATLGSGGKRISRASASASLKFNTEKEVFDFLGFPWLEPHERNL